MVFLEKRGEQGRLEEEAGGDEVASAKMPGGSGGRAGGALGCVPSLRAIPP